MELEGKVALITGGGSGIGKAAALLFAREGARVTVIGRTKVLELAKYRIRVNAVCPGAIDTDIEETTEQRNPEKAAVPVRYPAGDIPITGGKPGSAEQVAQLVLFLASDRSSHISGSPVWIDGAESLLRG